METAGTLQGTKGLKVVSDEKSAKAEDVEQLFFPFSGGVGGGRDIQLRTQGTAPHKLRSMMTCSKICVFPLKLEVKMKSLRSVEMTVKERGAWM